MPPTQKRQMRVAANRPDQMAAGGNLPDAFTGEITKARFVPWNYGGKTNPLLGAAIHITPDEDSGFQPFVQYYSAGRLEHFQPSNDGFDPVADYTDWDGQESSLEEFEGVYALPMGMKEQLPNSSNWAHFLEALGDCGFNFDALQDGGADITFVEGLRGRFDRVPQKERKNMPALSATGSEEGAKSFPKTILVLTELEKAAKGKAKGASKGAAKSAANGGGESLEAKVEKAIIAILNDNDGSMPRRSLNRQLVKHESLTEAERKQAISELVSEDSEFIKSAEGFNYDDEDDTLSLPE